MPTYAYRCDACAVELEKFQSITANPLRKCPHCGKFKLRRLLGTGAGILFKGSGFYQTDYRSDNYKEAAKKDKPADKKESPKKDAKSKPSAKDTGASQSSSGKSGKKKSA